MWKKNMDSFLILIVITNQFFTVFCIPAPAPEPAPAGPAVAAAVANTAGAAVGKVATKFFLWTGILTASGVAVSVADNYVKDKFERKRKMDFSRKRDREPDCLWNSYGCIAKMCWTNCGPRLDSTDYCLVAPPKNRNGNLTTTNFVLSATRNVTVVNCMHDGECDPCWKCAGSCSTERRDEQMQI